MIVNKVEICGVNTSKTPGAFQQKMKELLAIQKVIKAPGKTYQRKFEAY